ncbi:hypothetical protein J629_1162 [Acinetobacter baumannii 1207552]|nr:hypothetical protein J629_1162 [Acinetobacter baumannii 1207552]
MSVEMPEIKIVRHVRARKLRLRVEPASIRLTVPLFCSKKQIQQFLAQSEQWLIETWNKQHHVQSTSFEIPSEISFFNREQPFQIVVQKQHRIFQFDWEDSYLLKINNPIKLYKTLLLLMQNKSCQHFCQNLAKKLD